MAIPVDRTRAARTNAELRAIVEAVRDAPTAEPETDCIEWKSEWDLSEAKKAFHTARHLLGFGNRAPEAAARDFEGCAYFLAGVEPGTLCGVEPRDPAVIDDLLGRYIEAGKPRWTPDYVFLDGKQVLVIVVEAPREGDAICTLQKTYDSAQKGRAFVRRHGKTEEASPADIRMLETRIRAQRPKVNLAVIRADQGTLRAFSVSDAARRAWLDAEADRLALPPEPAPKERGAFDFTPCFRTWQPWKTPAARASTRRRSPHI